MTETVSPHSKKILGTKSIRRSDKKFFHHALQTLPTITTYQTFIRFEHPIIRRLKKPQRPKDKAPYQVHDDYDQQMQAYEKQLLEKGFTTHLGHLRNYRQPFFSTDYHGTEEITSAFSRRLLPVEIFAERSQVDKCDPTRALFPALQEGILETLMRQGYQVVVGHIELTATNALGHNEIRLSADGLEQLRGLHLILHPSTDPNQNNYIKERDVEALTTWFEHLREYKT